jgi:hypothetical protein
MIHLTASFTGSGGCSKIIDGGLAHQLFDPFLIKPSLRRRITIDCEGGAAE